jgi:hypothetical protein
MTGYQPPRRPIHFPEEEPPADSNGLVGAVLVILLAAAVCWLVAWAAGWGL